MVKHSDETREAAVAAIRSGRSYRDVEAELGVGVATLSRWAKDAGIESPNAAQTAAAAEATKIAWHQRRTALVDEFGDVASALLQKARDAERARDAQAFMTAVAIGVDKAQLLSGGVTSRHEQLDAQRRRERVEALSDELEQRRAKKDTATGG